MVANDYADVAISAPDLEGTTVLVVPIPKSLPSGSGTDGDGGRHRKRPKMQLQAGIGAASAAHGGANPVESATIVTCPEGNGRLNRARTALKNLAMAWPSLIALGTPHEALSPFGIDADWIDFVSGDVAILKSEYQAVIKRNARGVARPPRGATEVVLSLPQDPAFVAHIKHRGMLQRASALVAVGAHDRAKAELVALLLLLPTERVMCAPSPPHAHGGPGGDTVPQLEMTVCTDAVLVSRAFHLLFQCYEHEFSTQPSSNEAVSNLIVLCQHEWPLHARTFDSLLQQIASRHDFYFSEFFDFVATVDVMEEFM
jgi:hypothetical protein